jgi:sec-independent protein translocase protein TatC
MKPILKRRIWRGKPRKDALPGPAGSDQFDLAEMSFLEHLEEFRWALIKAIGSVVVVTIFCSFFSSWIIDVLLMGPAKSDFFVYRILGMEAEELVLQNRTITGQFFAHIGTIIAVGIVLGSPLFVYFMWRFMEPGLYPTEKKGLRFAAAFATVFFMLGIAFGYCVVTPFALQFFANYRISDLILNEFDITKYFGMVTFWAFGAGVLFELPVVVYFLAKVGILTPEVMRKYRKYALIVTLILGAFFTPPDPVSQVLVAIPLLILYEMSIRVAAVVTRRREKELEAALA